MALCPDSTIRYVATNWAKYCEAVGDKSRHRCPAENHWILVAALFLPIVFKLKRFKDAKYNAHSLADQSKAPHQKRKWEVTLIQEDRVGRLRERYPYYGKKKLKVLYEKEYSEEISTWKIERVIGRYELYPDQRKAEKTFRKRAQAREKPRKRITRLVKEGRPYFLFQIDTIVIYWDNLKRYILTAVDHGTKLGYARMYKNKSSRSAADFLYRLRYLVDQPIENLQTDNGSEFAWEFERASCIIFRIVA